ncbi:C40 family peptidase [Kitasatospora viridis]|uniref:Cell wall-associated NlpC family hydrolase n=1 Tax=Kitasatospora viridis TaxID=281105 RepID=A0A561UM28_9ACTN|nr:C40 family peptidase [Kitasatospora viridis]TWG00415.1 cell wall-associated NlpC family hydrolase [Kitasatospora viridis]
MASHRRPKPVGRTRASILTAAAATAVALSTQTSAHADPAPTLDQVKTQVDDLNQKAEAADQAYVGAQEKQQTLQQQASQLQDQVARQQDQVTNLQNGLAGMAADQYANGGISPTVQLMLNSHPDTFLNQVGSINELNSTQSATLKDLQQEQRKLDQDKTETTAKLAELDATTTQLKATKDDAQAKLKAAQDLLNSLTEQQRQAIAAQEAQAAAKAQAAAQQAAAQAQSAASQQQAASRGSGRTDLGSTGTPSTISAGNSHAAAAIAAAVSKLGSPYVYGATGPSTFDCSGLMQWAYAQAGVSLPRTSQEQASAGTNIGTDISKAQPGDLIIFFADESHVGMYVGGGQIIHAPHTGAVVRYESATVMQIAAIVRP